MQEVTFHLQTITPLFLAGADQSEAELRPPSFRGAMRYWHRALVGGLVGANAHTLQQVIKTESDVFGATDRGSAVTVKVSQASKEPQSYHTEGTRTNPSGKDYLLWSMAESGKGKPEKYKPDRLFFPPDTTFQVILSSRESDDTKLRQAITAFWLLTNLGGIGSRSRRCAGSLATDETVTTQNSVSTQVTQETVEHMKKLCFTPPQSVETLLKQLQTGITYARQSTLQFINNSPTLPIKHASFDALARQTCSIWILRDKQKSWKTSDIAMKTLGGSLQDYRSQFELHEREVFGLPLGRNTSRRASPLLLRVTEMLEEGYVGVAVLFKTGNPQPYTLIEEWANGFSGKEVVTF